MGKLTYEEMADLLERVEEEDRVGVLLLHRGPTGQWDPWSEQVIKVHEITEEGLLEAMHEFVAWFSPGVKSIEIVRKRGVVDRIKITREIDA